MNSKFLIAACAAAAFASGAVAGPFDQMKGKMKEGLYEMKIEMDMPGMPKGMGAQTLQHCLTAQDIESGKAAQGGNMPADCEVKNFRMSGNTASYSTACRGAQEMTSDTTMTFSDAGYRMESKVAMKQGGQVMNMTQKMESRYLGPCRK